MHQNTDEKLKALLRSSGRVKAPEGFEDRVMSQIQASESKRVFSLNYFIREYLPYLAAVIVIGGMVIANWNKIPWLSNFETTNAAEAEKTIMLFQSWFNGVLQVFNFLSSSSVAVLFMFSIVFYITADRILRLYMHKTKGNTAQLFL